VEGWVPLASDAQGQAPAKAAEPGRQVSVEGTGARRGPASAEVRLRVVTGKAPALTRVGESVVLALPAVHLPPHVYALVEVKEGRVHVTLRALRGKAPPGPAPLALDH